MSMSNLRTQIMVLIHVVIGYLFILLHSEKWVDYVF